MSEMHLKRRWFNAFMRHILICACARRLRENILIREDHYLKHVSFLCLKREMALNKHIKTKVCQKNNDTLKRVFMALKRHTLLARLC